MTRLTKLCLVFALFGLVAGLLVSFGVVDVGEHVGWFVTLPFGVTLLGFVLISYALENEVARFDEEQRPHSGGTESKKIETPGTENSGSDCHLATEAKSSS